MINMSFSTNLIGTYLLTNLSYSPFVAEFQILAFVVYSWCFSSTTLPSQMTLELPTINIQRESNGIIITIQSFYSAEKLF